MSRSRRDRAPDAVKKRPSDLRGLLRDASGRLRTGIRLAVALVLELLTSLLLRTGLNRLFAALFRAWNVRAGNVALAPRWARIVYAWHGSMISLLVSAALLALAVALRRWWMGGREAAKPSGAPARRRALAGWMVGTLAALVSAAVFLCSDSLRMEADPGIPERLPGLALLWGLSLCTVLSEEMFTRRVLYDGLREGCGVVPATAVSVAVFFFWNGGYAGNAVSAINVALLGVVCVLVYEKYGLWASTSLRWGWSFATVFLLGQGGGPHAAVRLYAVSESLLTGGDAGFVYGLWMTLLLLVALAWLLRRHLRKGFRGRGGRASL